MLVQTAGRFVGQKKLGIIGQRQSDCHALALPAGQLGRWAGPRARSSQRRPTARARSRRTRAEHGDFHVLLSAQLRHEIVKLKDQTDVRATVTRQIVNVREVFAADANRSRRRTIEGVNQVQHSRLTASGRTHNHHGLASLNAKRQTT